MKIRITPGAVLMLTVTAFTQGALFFAVTLAAAVHECGHMLAARALGIRLQLLELDLPGARLVTAGLPPSYRAEALLAAAGPAASLLLFAFTAPHHTPFFLATSAATLCLLFFNLLPIAGFDGGRVLSCLLAPVCGEAAARRVLCVSSYLCLLLLFSFSACLVLRYGENMMLALLCATFFAKLFLTQGEL